LLQKEEYGLVLVFCNTRHNADFVGNNLKNSGIDTLVIHGGLTQQKRNNIMEKFNEKKVYVLVCTDIASRGLDIKGISHVYNYDIPKTSKDYVHRIGRTARAGKEGIAINLISDRDYENFTNVLKDELLSIKNEKVPEVKMVHITLNKPGMHQRKRWDSNDWKARKSEGAKRFSKPEDGRGHNTNHRTNSRRGSNSSHGRRFGNRSHGRGNSFRRR
jgi:ATP-dependent RNA helicase DeaD